MNLKKFVFVIVILFTIVTKINSASSGSSGSAKSSGSNKTSPKSSSSKSSGSSSKSPSSSSSSGSSSGKSKCDPGCKSCKTPHACTVCLPGYILKTKKCYKCKLEGCGTCDADLKKCRKCQPRWFDATSAADKKKKQNKGLVLKCGKCGPHCLACNKKEVCQQCEKKFKLNSSFVCKPNNLMFMMLAIGVSVLCLILLVCIIIKCCCSKEDPEKKGARELKKVKKKKKEEDADSYDDYSDEDDGSDSYDAGRPANTTTRLNDGYQ